MVDFPREQCCCFTGHRDLRSLSYECMTNRVEKVILTLMKTGIVHYIAGGAVGFDMAASIAVINLKKSFPALTLTLAFPCPEHTLKWNDGERVLLERIRLRADRVLTVSNEYSKACMLMRDRYLVDHSAVCACYLRDNTGGGTRYTVQYAEKSGVTVYNLFNSADNERILL